MTRRDDDKTLLTEILPDPERAASGPGTPRQRTHDHLRKILAAASIALQLPVAGALADSSLPPGKKGDDGKKKPPADAAATKKPKPKPKPPTPPETPGYYVVDMMPEPADVPPPPKPEKPAPEVQPGFLSLASTVSAAIRVDGKDTGLRTPQTRMKLDPGVHAVTLIDSAGRPLETFTVTIAAGKETSERRDPRRPPIPPIPK